MERKLNLDVAKSVAIFERLMNEIPPKKVLYRVIFRGKGLEFDGYRLYGQDEDASNIDWKATLRAGFQLARKYIEERDLNFMFVVDMGENMVFGSQEKLKCEIAVELIAAFSNVILNSGDRVGFILYNKEIFRIVLPKNGTKQFEIFVHELSIAENYDGSSSLSNILEDLYKILPPKIDIIVIVSDFIKVKEENRHFLEWLGNNYETIAISIKDPLDISFPEINREIVIEDPETGEKKLINPKIAKMIYQSNSERKQKFIKRIFEDSNIDFLDIYTNDDFIFELAEFLKRRATIV